MLDIDAISTNLELGPDGIWYAKGSQHVSYPSGGHDLCYAVEDKSFWFRHRNQCILSVIRSYPPVDRGAVFDIGGGNGFVSAALASSGFDVALVEPGTDGALNAKRRGLDHVICATTDTARFKPGSLPAVGLFDVIEHIEDDRSFLASIKALMKAQGCLYATVPAYSLLWSDEDVSAGHYRRYTRKGICEVIESAGFEVEFSSYIFRFLPVPIALLRALPFRLGISRAKNDAKAVARDHVAGGGGVAGFVESLLRAEIDNLDKRKTMSFGGSCLIVAKSR